MDTHSKMHLDTLNDKLLMFEQYKLQTKTIIDLNENQDVFYFISFNNQVLKANCLSINKTQQKELTDYSSILDYIEDRELKFFGKFSYETKINLNVMIYIIPRHQETKKDFKSIFDIYYSFLGTVSYKNYFETIQNNLKLISFVIALCFSVYSSYLYVALHDIGIPIQNAFDINIILSISAFLFISIISIFTFIPLLLLAILHYANSLVPYLLIAFILIIFLLTVADKFIWVQTYKFIKKTNNFIADFLITMLSPKIFSIAIAFIIFLPVIYIYDNIRFHQSNSQVAQPTFLYSLYHTFTGYPKISDFDNHKYLVTGTDSVNYVVYDINSTLRYLHDANTSNFEQLCRNIKDNYNDKNTLIYEILSHSYKNIPENATFLNVKDNHLILNPLTLESLDINKSQLQRNCQSFLLKKDSVK